MKLILAVVVAVVCVSVAAAQDDYKCSKFQPKLLDTAHLALAVFTFCSHSTRVVC